MRGLKVFILIILSTWESSHLRGDFLGWLDSPRRSNLFDPKSRPTVAPTPVPTATPTATPTPQILYRNGAFGTWMGQAVTISGTATNVLVSDDINGDPTTLRLDSPSVSFLVPLTQNANAAVSTGHIEFDIKLGDFAGGAQITVAYGGSGCCTYSSHVDLTAPVLTAANFVNISVALNAPQPVSLNAVNMPVQVFINSGWGTFPPFFYINNVVWKPN